MIKEINLYNWVCHKERRVPLDRVTWLVGPNGSGKSAILDAIRFALTGQPTRVKYKKDLSRLILHGSAQGSVALELDDGAVIRRDIASGKVSSTLDSHEIEAIAKRLAFALDSTAFSRMKAGERQKVVEQLVSMTFSEDDVRAEVEKVVQVTPAVEELVRMAASGMWDAASEKMKQNASIYRAKWETVTGEKYGRRKAEEWIPNAPVPTMTREDVAGLRAEVEALERECRDLRDQARANEQAQRTTRAHVEQLQKELEKAKECIGSGQALDVARVREAEKAAEREVEEIRNGCEALRNELSLLEARLDLARQSLECPECGKALLLVDGRLQPAGDIDVTALEAEVRAKREALGEARDRLRRAVDRHVDLGQRLERALQADAALKALDATEASIASMTGELNDLVQEGERLKARIEEVEGQHQDAAIRHAEVAAQWAAVDDARRKADEAMSLHQGVELSLKLAEAFGPDGIRKRLVERALAPLNEMLAAIGNAAGWGAVHLDADMNLSLLRDNEFRPYSLLSKSEQWRVDVTVTAALCLSGDADVCVFDEADILDSESRAGFGTLVRQLADGAFGRKLQVIVLATISLDEVSTIASDQQAYMLKAA